MGVTFTPEFHGTNRPGATIQLRPDTAESLDNPLLDRAKTQVARALSSALGVLVDRLRTQRATACETIDAVNAEIAALKQSQVSTLVDGQDADFAHCANQIAAMESRARQAQIQIDAIDSALPEALAKRNAEIKQAVAEIHRETRQAARLQIDAAGEQLEQFAVEPTRQFLAGEQATKMTAHWQGVEADKLAEMAAGWSAKR